MQETYSLKKGFYKGLLSLVSVAGFLIAFTKFGDLSIWSLLEEYLKPVLGAITISGAITMLMNWVKFKSNLGKKNR